MDRIGKNLPGRCVKTSFWHGLKLYSPNNQNVVNCTWSLANIRTWQLPFGSLAEECFAISGSNRPAVNRAAACGRLASGVASPWWSPDPRDQSRLLMGLVCVALHPLTLGLEGCVDLESQADLLLLRC